jgi:protease IV
MPLETETVLDRRRLRRHVSLWRTLAIIAGVAALGVMASMRDGKVGFAEPRQIARVAIEGVITEDRAQLQMLRRIADAKYVEGVILFVNSPGGTTTGGEALFDALRSIAEKKPIVAQFGTVAASAGYIVGLGTDHIIARGNTITGSVGVIMQWPEVSELLAKLGVKVNEIKSGSLKASPSPFQPADEPSKQVAQSMIMEGQRWFLSLVTARRNVKTAEIAGLEQGRVFSGREAQTLKLVDEIGGESEALRYLQEKRNVRKDLKIVDWKPKRQTDWGALTSGEASLTTWLAGRLFGDLGTRLAQDPGLGSVGLDGMLSVWHPGKN